VEIVTPIAVAWQGSAGEVQAPGILGEFGALPEHAPMLAVTRAGVVTLHLEGGDKKRLVVGPGFAEVGPDRVTLLVDSCEVAEDIDKAAAQKVLEWAERTLLDTEPDSGPWLDAHKQIELSRARIEA
jgi:F-type H+-transporting ATPase subunit epsilon